MFSEEAAVEDHLSGKDQEISSKQYSLSLVTKILHKWETVTTFLNHIFQKVGVQAGSPQVQKNTHKQTKIY